MTVRRSYGPFICPMPFTCTTILPTYPVVFLLSNFGQVPSPPIVPYIMIIHWYALHMSWNQDFSMLKSFLSGFQGLVELNIWEPPLCVPSRWSWLVTYIMATSALSLLWCLMTISILFMQDRINNPQFGQN